MFNLLPSGDQRATDRVMAAMMQMIKMDIAALQAPVTERRRDRVIASWPAEEVCYKARPLSGQ